METKLVENLTKAETRQLLDYLHTDSQGIELFNEYAVDPVNEELHRVCDQIFLNTYTATSNRIDILDFTNLDVDINVAKKHEIFKHGDEVKQVATGSWLADMLNLEWKQFHEEWFLPTYQKLENVFNRENPIKPLKKASDNKIDEFFLFHDDEFDDIMIIGSWVGQVASLVETAVFESVDYINDEGDDNALECLNLARAVINFNDWNEIEYVSV